MADDQFHQASGNWWDHNSARNNNMRFESGASSSSSQSSISSSGIANNNNNNFASMDSSSSVVFHDHHHKLHTPDSTTSTDPNLHMMGLGLSSPTMDWNQPSLLRGEKGGENSFRSMLQENLGSSRSNFQESGMLGLSQVQWRAENNGGIRGNNNNNNNNFSLDQNQFSPQYSSGDSTVTTSFHHHNMDSTALYGSPSSILMQGLLGPENSNHHQQHQQAMNFNLSYPSSYGLSSSNNELVVPSNWNNNNNSNNKQVPQFLRGSPPKQLPPQQPQPQPHNSSNNNQLHFTNNAPFWNASDAAAAIKDVRSSFFPSLQQPPFSPAPNFDVQSKNVCEVRESGGVVKKSGSEPTPKRPRNETNPSPLPALKVRKEKMGDRITALQQLVSPFGKTDTASVLSEAIEYIKFLHEQVNVLSTPYMKSGAPIQIQQSSGKSKEGDGPKQDLRSRGLCLVPVSSTFPVTHETTVDFWTPPFGGSSR